MIKRLIMIALITFSSSAFAAFNSLAALPTFYSDLSIDRIDTVPNSSSPTYGYNVILKSNLPDTGCSYPDHFVVESGAFQDESFSVLLAAMMADKKIRIRVVRCSDRPVVDRVSILSD